MKTDYTRPTLPEISAILSSTCQPCMAREIASIADDALSGAAPLAPLHLDGFAGLGKTHGIENVLFGQILAPAGWELVIVPVGCAPSVFNRLLVDHCPENGGDCPKLFFIDEIHALPKATRNLLKIATETGGRVKTYTVPLGREDFSVSINPLRHWFISASNEAVKDSALVGSSGRFRAASFVPYDEAGKQKIFRALLPVYGLNDVIITEETEQIILRNVRPFARSIKAMIESLRVAVKMQGCNLKTKAGVATALRAQGYYPGGWTQLHIDILKFLSQSPMGRQVQEIAMGPGRGRDRAVITGLLDELMQGNLVITNVQGRKQYTREALALLQDLEAKKAKKA